MNAKRFFGVALVAVLSALLIGAVARADDASGPVYDMSVLDGDWRVVSTTWGGDPADFADATYTLKINKETVMTKDDITQFTITINGGSGFVSGIDNQTFCAQRYSRLQNSYSFFHGYQKLDFWVSDDYPCVFEEQEQSDSELYIESSRRFMRFDVVSPKEAHVVFYYEGAGSIAYLESRKEDVAKDVYFKDMSKPVCYAGVCLVSATAFTGIFEVELEKIK